MSSSKSSIDQRDVYYRLGKSAGYRARSAYKLLHLDEEFDLFSGVKTAVDLCAAPGSWSQVLGQRLSPGKEPDDPKVVSVDLQPMAPLPNITILETDITLPSTIPLVLDALGGRKADLVVCDGAPDVTGVHDLDAYLHSQLLLAALTLSLTLLAPQATLIFKIFLSPLDPQASMLRSQLQVFFSSPLGEPSTEFDETDIPGQAGTINSSRVTFDRYGRRGGVWVRKPRSSRKGSGEAFIVCRNFNGARVPLPSTFPPQALDALRKETKGTLTLDSLSALVPSHMRTVSPEWEGIKAYVGSGDLDGPDLDSTSAEESDRHLPIPGPSRRNLPLELRINTDHRPLSRASSVRSPVALHSQPTPCEEHDAYFAPSASFDEDYLSPRPHLDSIARQSNATRRASAMAAKVSASRQASLDSLSSPSASPTSNTRERPWERHTTPLPSPNLFPPNDVFSATSPPMGSTDGTHSPAASIDSKTRSFFATSSTLSLPTPPKPMPVVQRSPVGNGWPGQLSSRERTTSLPVRTLDDKSHARTASMGLNGVPLSPRQSLLSEPTSPSSRRGNLPETPGVGSPKLASDMPSDSIPTLPTHLTMSARPNMPLPRRESLQLPREHREFSDDDAPLSPGYGLLPLAQQEEPDSRPRCRWRLGRLLGEGAFSAVWSVEELNGVSIPAAVKLTSRATCSSDARTRIAFLREVSVLRHISHPNIVAFISSFSTAAYHCLVIERLTGGELFELMAYERDRQRMTMAGPSDPGGEGLIRRIFGELVNAVGWLHEVGVVHRDIKLENILFATNPFLLPPSTTGSIPLEKLPRPLIKLTDFGLSRFIDPASPLLQTRCGSESFAAPEIIMAKTYDGRQTDAWAMGVVLYALVTGELPFDGQDTGRGEREDRKRKMMRIAKGQYTWSDGVGSAGLREVVAKLLVRDPMQRIRVGQLREESWMRGPGEVLSPQYGGLMNGEDCLGGTKRRRVLDGFLLDEEIGDEAKAEMEI